MRLSLAEKWEWNGTRRSRRSPSFPDLQDSQGTQMELEKGLEAKFATQVQQAEVSWDWN